MDGFWYTRKLKWLYITHFERKLKKVFDAFQAEETLAYLFRAGIIAITVQTQTKLWKLKLDCLRHINLCAKNGNLMRQTVNVFRVSKQRHNRAWQEQTIEGGSIKQTDRLFNYADNCYVFMVSWNMCMENWWNDTDGGENLRNRRKDCPSATLATT